MLCRMILSLVFPGTSSSVRLELRIFRENATEVKSLLVTSYQGHVVSMIIVGIINVGWFRRCLSGFSTEKLLLFLFPPLSLEGSR